MGPKTTKKNTPSISPNTNNTSTSPKYNTTQIDSARSAALIVAKNASFHKLKVLAEHGGSSPLTGSTCFGALTAPPSSPSSPPSSTPKKKGMSILSPTRKKKQHTNNEAANNNKNKSDLQKATERGSLLGSGEVVDVTPGAIPSSPSDESESGIDMDLTSYGSGLSLSGTHTSTTSSSSKKLSKMKRVFPKGSIIKLRVKKRRKGHHHVRLGTKKRKKGSGGDDGSVVSQHSHGSISLNGNGIDDAGTVMTKTKEATENAWMCGLCGLAFTGQRLAEVHEFNCVRETFYRTANKNRYEKEKEEEEEEEKKEEEEEVRMTSSEVADFFMNGADGEKKKDANNIVEENTATAGDDEFHPSLETIREIDETFNRNSSELSAPHKKDIAATTGDSTTHLESVPAATTTTTTDNDTPTSPTQPPPQSKNQKVVILEPPKTSNTSTNNNTYTAAAKNKQQLGLIHLSNSMRQCILMTDESLLKVSNRADLYTINTTESDAERELALLSRDRAYYDMLALNAKDRAFNKSNPLHSNGKGVLSSMRNKFAEAYELMKENEGSAQDGKKSLSKGAGVGGKDITHVNETLYINVIIRNSTRVVNNEMKRLANKRWDTVEQSAVISADKKKGEGDKDEVDKEKDKGGGKGGVSDFEKFRLKAQRQMVKIASLALSSDFTPRRVAVQLSDDLVWLLEPQLKLRGVSIETQIEYRVGPYFVLGVNINSINWMNLIEHSHKQCVDRQEAYEQEMESNKKKMDRHRSRMSISAAAAAAKEGGGGGGGGNGGGDNKEEGKGDGEEENKRKGIKEKIQDGITRIKSTTVSDIVATVLGVMYYINWVFVIPFCSLAYRCGLRPIVDTYILNSVTNDIFRYVEKKGMEMNLSIVQTPQQASFMLAALREMRADDRKFKKKREETEAEEEGEKPKELLGPLLGPAIKEDAGPAEEPPAFVPPENLEHIGLEIDLPVGYRRVRWAFLSSKSEFTPKAVFEAELGYTENVFGEWSNHDEHVGGANLPDNLNHVDFIGLEKQNSYLMPKSAFVKANTAHETMEIIEYNDFCFAIKYKTLTPEVPYGNTFIAWTQIVVTNTGKNTCRMVCSVEAEFPNGPPMVARQIKSGMRAGTAEKFVAIGETVIQYADSYP